MIHKDQPITCAACSKIIYYANRDISYRAQLVSQDLRYWNNRPVEKFARLSCPHCEVEFFSISTETATTVTRLVN